MSLSVEQFGDVRRLRMSSAGSRAAGLDVSAYVVRGTMVDCGFHRARRALLDVLAPQPVEGVIVTHWHEDHAGNVALLASRGVPLLLRAETEDTLRRRPDIQLYRRVVWGHPPALDAIVTPYVDSTLECIHTPGHSADHQVVWDQETGTIFSGDLWLGVRSRVVHAAEDPYTIIRSLRAVAGLGPQRMFDAHRGRVDRPIAALLSKADWLAATLGDIERRVGEGWSDREIVKRLLGGEERAAYVSGGDYSRRNLVKAVRRRLSG